MGTFSTDWCGCDSKTWSACWYKLITDPVAFPDDARASLTWRGWLQNSAGVLVNYNRQNPDRWLHSDCMNAAHFYTHRLFKRIIEPRPPERRQGVPPLFLFFQSLRPCFSAREMSKPSGARLFRGSSGVSEYKFDKFFALEEASPHVVALTGRNDQLHGAAQCFVARFQET